MSSPSLDQLKRAIAVKEQIEALEAELTAILGEAEPAATGKRKYTKRAAVEASTDAKPVKKPKRKMSAEGRAKIIAAQKRKVGEAKDGEHLRPTLL